MRGRKKNIDFLLKSIFFFLIFCSFLEIFYGHIDGYIDTKISSCKGRFCSILDITKLILMPITDGFHLPNSTILTLRLLLLQ